MKVSGSAVAVATASTDCRRKVSACDRAVSGVSVVKALSRGWCLGGFSSEDLGRGEGCIVGTSGLIVQATVLLHKLKTPFSSATGDTISGMLPEGLCQGEGRGGEEDYENILLMAGRRAWGMILRW